MSYNISVSTWILKKINDGIFLDNPYSSEPKFDFYNSHNTEPTTGSSNVASEEKSGFC